MFYKVLIVFFVILIFLFGCLIFTVHDRHRRPILCSKLTNAKWTCEREADCPAFHELIKDYEIHHCGGDEYDSKICCPPHTPHDHHKHEDLLLPGFNTKHIHPHPAIIVQHKCQEYAQYRFVGHQNIESEPDDKPILHEILECVEIEPAGVGGADTEEEEFPHMALLGYGEKIDKARWQCAGTLISELFILTAAHCTPDGIKPNETWALLGAQSRLNATADRLGSNVFRIIEYFNHPDYDKNTQKNDIALYKLEAPIKFGPSVRPVCLATNSELSANATGDDDMKASITGWGAIGPGMRHSDNLLKAAVRILTNDECKSNTSFNRTFDSESMLCADNIGESKDTCVADMGGPLQIPLQIPLPNTECMWSQIGIVMNDYKECGNGRPAVYMSVVPYIPWIQKIVWP